MIAILKQPQFLMFCMGQLFSRFGDGLTTIVILYVVGTTSNDPLLIGFVLFCQYSPMFFFGLFGGVAADRFKKHHIMIAADLFRSFILIGMIFSLHHPVYVIILVFLSGIGSAFFYPARSSYIPVVVGEKILQKRWGFLKVFILLCRLRVLVLQAYFFFSFHRQLYSLLIFLLIVYPHVLSC